jgi:hypothetical protein
MNTPSARQWSSLDALHFLRVPHIVPRIVPRIPFKDKFGQRALASLRGVERIDTVPGGI